MLERTYAYWQVMATERIKQNEREKNLFARLDFTLFPHFSYHLRIYIYTCVWIKRMHRKSKEKRKKRGKNLSFIHLSFFSSSILLLRQDQKASATSTDNSKLHAEIHLTIITDPSQVFLFIQYKHISIYQFHFSMHHHFVNISSHYIVMYNIDHLFFSFFHHLS